MEDKNPCEGCIVEIICIKMCPRVIIHYKENIDIDKNFDWESYTKRSDKLYQKKFKKK